MDALDSKDARETGQPTVVDLLESILSIIGTPRLDLSQAIRLSEEVWPRGLDELLDMPILSSEK